MCGVSCRSASAGEEEDLAGSPRLRIAQLLLQPLQLPAPAQSQSVEFIGSLNAGVGAWGSGCRVLGVGCGV